MISRTDQVRSLMRFTHGLGTVTADLMPGWTREWLIAEIREGRFAAENLELLRDAIQEVLDAARDPEVTS